MAQSVWAALGEIEDHFAMLSGAARYAGFEDGDPPLIVGLLLQLELSIPGALAEFQPEHGLNRERLRILMGEMAGGSQGLTGCLDTLLPWDPDRFPDAMIGRVISRLSRGVSNHRPSSADVAEYAEWISRKLPRRDSKRWDLFLDYVVESEKRV